MTKLYLVDGSGFIFRAFHALPPMTRGDGTPVNAVFGFCTMLQKLLDDQSIEKIAVIFDASRKTFRNEIYKEYKAHRPPPPPELVPQFDLIRQATRAYGLPSIEVQNFEADDVIASIARAANNAGMAVRIVSSDKDLMQLIGDGVEMFDPLKSIPIGREQVLEKFGVEPDKVVDVQALAGDSTDNVPGVPGIGIKTAAELIRHYGNLETLLEKAEEIKQPKRREALIQNAKLARISKRLVQLDAGVPLPMPLADMVVCEDKNAQRAFLMEQGFKSIIARMDGGGDNSGKTETPIAQPQTPASPAPPAPAIEKNYECVQDVNRLKWWVEQARLAGKFALDTETTSLRACTAKLVGLSLAIAPGMACYVPIGHIDPGSGAEGDLMFATSKAPQQIPLHQVAECLRDVLADESVLKIGHNIKYDMQVLAQHGLVIKSYDDTMLISYVLSAGKHGHGLDGLALLYFQHKMISYDDVTGKGQKRIGFAAVDLALATDYAAEDADYSLRLWHTLKPQLAQNHLVRVYERIERPIVDVVADMETAGILVDRDILKTQSGFLGTRLQACEAEIHSIVGHSFNVGSPKQLGEVLFAEMGLAGGVKGKAGAYSTSAEVLEEIAEQGKGQSAKLAEKVLDWRGLSKLKTTYTDALPDEIDAKTGRVHTSFSLVGAATGRLSSTNPNLQNIPIKSEEGRAIRQAFVAKPGHELLSVDYSQIELRLAAHSADIKALIKAFHDGTDIHALTASQVFGIKLADVTTDQRRSAKAINFGIIYGISGFGLAKQLGCSAGQAGDFIKAYLDNFHELRDWMQSTKDFAREHGYVETLFGRRVHIDGIMDKGARRAGAERAAINAPLQGAAADLMKRAMIRVVPELKVRGLTAKLLLQVHDELIFEVAQEEIDATTAIVKAVMEGAGAPVLALRVPLIAEAGHGKNWATAH